MQRRNLTRRNRDSRGGGPIDLDDETLAGRGSAGDDAAFEILIDRYLKKVFNIAFRLLGDRDDAHIVTRKVFLEVHGNLNGFESNQRFRNWVYRIAVRESIARLEDERLVSDGVDPSSNVQRAVMSLQPTSRAVIILRHFFGCSYRDMSYILEIPEKTIKTLLFTARRKLDSLISTSDGQARQAVSAS